MLTGADDWDSTTPETEHNWLNVSGLIHGVAYQLRIAAIDRHGDAMKSEAIQFVTGVQSGIFSYSMQICFV